jgi:hypothetical protein
MGLSHRLSTGGPTHRCVKRGSGVIVEESTLQEAHTAVAVDGAIRRRDRPAHGGAEPRATSGCSIARTLGERQLFAVEDCRHVSATASGSASPGSG